MVLIRKDHDHHEILANLYENVTTIFLKSHFVQCLILGPPFLPVFEICPFLVARRDSPNNTVLKGIILEKEVWFNS